MPGVPPDAVDNVKKLLKGIFKRGKNRKQDTSSQTSTPSQQAASTAASPEEPPQLPQPQVAGQSDPTQQTVPTNHDAQTGAPGDVSEADRRPVSEGVSPTSPNPVIASPESASAPAKPADPTAVTTGLDAEVAKAEDNTAKEDVPPPATTGASEQASGTEANTTATAATSAAETKENKAPQDPEPPAIPKTQPAPGMSATSGPLEDFPSVGDSERKE